MRKITWTSAPEIVDSPLPTITDPKNTISLPNLHAIWSLWAYDDNLGHILWEEMAGLYFAMSRMNVLTDNLIAMHYPYDLPTRKLSIKFRQAFFPGISKTQPVNLREYVSSVLISNGSGSIAQNICFEQLLVGGNMRRFLHSVAWHNHGHEEMFRNLRANILTAHGIDPTSTPNESHHIVITNKTETNFKADSTVGERKRAIANLDEVVAWIKDKYGPNIEVSCVEWQKMSVKDQLNLMVSATVFISPPGGVSMMLPFLPNGAHAIIMDYLENEPNNWYGTRVGDSISMESPFWNHWPHVKKLYYQIHGKQDMVSDSTSKTLDEVSWREGVSYVIDMTRLEGLLEQAFHTMEN
ncbi:hypothetical protein HK100_008275 [Physocladia obscura]|uniref:Glycosyltransferase 61 catalytic domain-containing protein n=1 Tax=Physocladia obscura TaxID=109957 RepID=A0AAD5TA19_9FUNG|nr:hypothetical protein HK100_008275 [Physocladia obscura]